MSEEGVAPELIIRALRQAAFGIRFLADEFEALVGGHPVPHTRMEADAYEALAERIRTEGISCPRMHSDKAA